MTSTAKRVPRHTAPRLNRQLEEDASRRVEALQSNSAGISRRLGELDREWDIERAIEANAAVLALTGIGLSIAHDRRWILLPAAVTSFLLQHALQGWCPPVPILRRLGFRTAEEINEERYALKAVRGDFSRVQKAKDKARASLDAVGMHVV